MKLNDLLNGEFTDWADDFIQPYRENEIISNLTSTANYIDFSVYDARICKENDCQVIEQYDKDYGKPWYEDDYDDEDPLDDRPIEIDVDTASWDDDYFKQFMLEKYLNYVSAFGFDNSQIGRRWKLNKIRKIMMGK
jgi:hypothetical protein